MIAYFIPAIVAGTSLIFTAFIDFLHHTGNVRLKGDDE